MKIQKTVVLSLLLAALLLGACSRQNLVSTNNNENDTEPKQERTEQKTTASKDPCLLEKNEVAKFFPGGNITITTRDSEPNPVGQKICFYDASEDDMLFAQISVQRTQDMAAELKKSGANAQTMFESTKSYLDNTTEISGIGKEAYYGGSGLTLGAGLNVLVNKDVSFNIMVGLGFGNNDQQKHLEIEKEMALTIMERI
jgi:hypothetical protein